MATATPHVEVKLYDFHPSLDGFRSDALSGLQKLSKAVPPKYLYDQKGSQLFDAICAQPEYYLTKTEMTILEKNAAEIAKSIGQKTLVEYGSGSSQKIRLLLAAAKVHCYVALDISRQHLYQACEILARDFPGLRAVALCTDYTKPLPVAEVDELKENTIGFFPGSSIGNFEPEEAVEFLKNASVLGDLIIGVDLKKSPEILETAYDDPKGAGSDFAMNLLVRMNRELGADFNLSEFKYHSQYNSEAGRIEMSIRSLKDQVVRFGDLAEISFHQGEALLTEHSYKYSIEEFKELASKAGFKSIKVWTDEDHLFSVHHLKRVDQKN